MFRIGQGYDVHRLAEGETLWLGGILIPHRKGTVAHSDGDVLIHAICDALLGAVNLGDIGTHFPDNSEKFKNIDSKILLKETDALIKNAGFEIVNIDTTISAQQPKLKPFTTEMKKVMAEVLGIETGQISIKATTTEKLGFEGREEGISALAVVLVEKK
ncbi:MAG: 2-C-methyl-D-erythritol 2,4-cyclodiphosphate synthase [Mariniphaga sp.]|jgi:2-C-methyl-D-erythritol 2,4-cyclodiphosphate synthase|nr:2-C-methyl-D-erythritol 2,4-cyclodiphosphate synthase [Mariniphaga sp.]